MKNTRIETADHTFNPWEGCAKVSPGCKNCFAARRDQRLHKGKHWGPNAARRRMRILYWDQPVKWNKEPWIECRRYRGPALSGGICPVCGDVGKPTKQRVLCGTLCDVFENRAIVNPWRRDLFELVQGTPDLDWFMYTKRTDFASEWLAGIGRHWPNISLTASVEDQQTADERIGFLLSSKRFVGRVGLSVEPLLDVVDLSPWVHDLDFIYLGGETGPKARIMPLEAVLAVRDACREAGLPLFFKSWGEWLPITNEYADLIPGDPPRLTMLNGQLYTRLGRKNTGRRLGGETFTEQPPDIERI